MKTDQQTLAENIYTAILVQYYLPMKNKHTDKHESLIDDLLVAKDLAQKMAGVWYGWNTPEDQTAYEAIRKMIYELNLFLESLLDCPPNLACGNIDEAIKIGYSILGPDDDESSKPAKARTIIPDIPVPTPIIGKARIGQIMTPGPNGQKLKDMKDEVEHRLALKGADDVCGSTLGVKHNKQGQDTFISCELRKGHPGTHTAQGMDPWPHA